MSELYLDKYYIILLMMFKEFFSNRRRNFKFFNEYQIYRLSFYFRLKKNNLLEKKKIKILDNKLVKWLYNYMTVIQIKSQFL